MLFCCTKDLLKLQAVCETCINGVPCHAYDFIQISTVLNGVLVKPIKTPSGVVKGDKQLT
jgi:hypothetical protein